MQKAGRYPDFGTFMLCVMAAARSVSPDYSASLQYVRIQGPVSTKKDGVHLPTLVPISKERSPSSHAASSVSARLRIKPFFPRRFCIGE